MHNVQLLKLNIVGRLKYVAAPNDHGLSVNRAMSPQLSSSQNVQVWESMHFTNMNQLNII